MDDREAARLIGAARVVFGSWAFLAPGTFTKACIGRQARPYPTNMMVRGLGARDCAIGLGTLAALEKKKRSVSSWLQAGALGDAADAVGTVAAWRPLPKVRALFLLGLTSGSAVVGARLASALD